MRRSLLLALTTALLCTGPYAEAAKRKLTVNAETPEGEMLQKLTGEQDPAKKLTMMEEFAAKYPTHESATWVLGEMHGAYMKANAFDKAIAAAEKVIAVDPDDVAMLEGSLKAAEGKKDAAAIRKWAASTHAAATKVAASPKPSDEDEAEHWKATVEYVQQAAKYSEYAVYVAALAATAPAERIELGETLEKLNPKSEYMTMYRPTLLAAYQQAGNHAKGLASAEEGLKADPNNDDMLLYAASRYYEMKDKAKATAYAKRLVETLPSKAVPQGVNEADWTKNRDLKLGIGNWMLGVIASGDQKWTDADTYLRAALPNLSANKDLQAETLFHLGLANFRIGDPKKDKARINDALKFNQQCSLIASPFQAQAKKNVAVIKTQYHIP